MKLKFKKQDYQTKAVESIVNCFKGQPNTSGIGYRIDPGLIKVGEKKYIQERLLELSGFKNSDVVLNPSFRFFRKSRLKTSIFKNKLV